MSDIKELKKDVKAILENHLPHINLKLKAHDLKLNLILWFSGIIATVLIGYLVKAGMDLIVR